MPGGWRLRSGEWRVAPLGRWWFLASVAVLVANDHLFKAAFPGPVTGKISDFVGPAAVAVVAAVLIGRTSAVVLTALGFTALKTVPGVAEAAEPVLGGVTLRDATDLVGLVVLPFVWRALAPAPGREPHDAVASTPAALAPAPSDRQARGTVRTVGPHSTRTAVDWMRTKVLPVGGAALAVVAFTATGQARLTGVDSLAVSGDTVFAELVVADDEEPAAVARSLDGGLTWEAIDDDAQSGAQTGVPAEAARGSEEACRRDGRCFAARGGAIEEKGPDGEWSTAFSLEGGRREMIEYRRPSGGTDLDELFESVVVVDGAEGESVVVAARDQGVVVLGPSGRWERTAVLDAKPTSTNGSMAPLDVATTVLIVSLPVALVAAVVIAISRRRSGGWTVIGSIVGAMLVAGATWALAVGTWALGTFTTQKPIPLAMVLFVLAAAVVLLPMAFVRRATGPSATTDP